MPSPTPLRVLIGFSPRSASDDLLNSMAPALSAALERPIHIELMPGELGARAARAFVAGEADGHTVLVATFGTHAINPNLRDDLGYDPLLDFEPICLATRAPLVLGTGLPVDNVQALIELGLQQTLTYGSSGVGSAPYLAGLLFEKLTGVKLEHRAYPDTRELYGALEEGSLDLSFNNPASMLPKVREGSLRALAVTTPQRSAALPAVPTLDESGLSGFALNNWLGFVAPKGTSLATITVLNSAIARALKAAQTQALLDENGIEAVAGTPAQFARHLADELARWAWLRG
ncbi:tripartite tricarboxylate transporter substrate-binding protein [Pseudomonas tolaasii]|uniref:Bug family tripartite tricarboxylate transporter substrate binding protein n=1 Tax=Pseudomonas tolaasii TaxID=29442 RepID=UPI0030D2C26F